MCGGAHAQMDLGLNAPGPSIISSYNLLKSANLPLVVMRL